MMNNNNNYSTMNDYNNDYDNTMSNNLDDSSSIPIAEAVLSTPAQQHQPEPTSALYKLAARNLREYHGVPSMTALKLEKTVALLDLRPRRLVAQGLAPWRLLKDNSSPLVLAGESLDEAQEELLEAETGVLMDGSGDNLFYDKKNHNSWEDEEEDDEDSNSTYNDNGDTIDNFNKGEVEGLEADGNENGEKKRPIHAALVAGGINLRPRETRPLLRALGISPHRLVKLGLVKREAVRAMPGRRGSDRGQHLRAGEPGKRGVGRPLMGGPHGPPRGPRHAHHCCQPSAGGGPSRPMHGPPHRPFHGAEHHAVHLGGQSEEDMSAPLGPHGGPGYRGPRHQGGPSHGPGRHSVPTGRHGRGPPGGGKHGHGHRHGQCGGGLHSESEGEGGERLHGRGAGGRGQHGPRRHGGGMGGPRGPPHDPPRAHHCCELSSGGGPSRPMHGPCRPFHGSGHHAVQLGREREEESMSAPLGPHGGPGHRCRRQLGRGGMGCPRGSPQQGPPRGPFHGLFHEEASGAPLGMMAHPHHGSPSRGRGGIKQRGGRHGGGTEFYGGGGGGGGGDGGDSCDMQRSRRAHVAHFHGGRRHPQLEVY